MRKMRFLIVTVLALASAACAATNDRNTAERANGMQGYVWYDGDMPRQVWLDPELVVEFGRSKDSSVRQAIPQAREVPSTQPGIRLWQVPEQAAQAARSVRAKAPGAEVSPVLRDAPGRDAPMRALPGNVTVYLDPSWSEQQARGWLENRNLEIVRKLDFGENIFLVRSEPGLASLELANSLHGQEGVVAAMPDWWVQVEKR